MELTVGERLILLQIIPPQTGSLTKLKIVQKLRTDLSFDEAEHSEFGVKEEPGSGLIRWDRNKDKAVEIEIGEVANSIIVEAIKMGDGKGDLREEWLPVLERFPSKEDPKEEPKEK